MAQRWSQDVCCQIGNHINHLSITRLSCMMKGSAEYEVPYQNGNLIRHQGIYGSLAATSVTFVHHIIMHQTGGMQQFQCQGHIIYLLIHPAEKTGREKNQGRPDQLALLLKQVIQGLLKQSILTLKRGGKLLSVLLQNVSDRFL